MAHTTLQTLAKSLGVSRTTVSNAYSRPEKLSVELRERIIAAAQELGYDGPSPLAASLRRGHTDSLGVLFTDDLGYAFSDPVSALFLAGLAEKAQEAGYALTIVSAPRGSTAGPISKAMVDGLIVYSVDEDSPGLPVARRRGIPSVFVDQAPQDDGSALSPSVNINDREGSALAVSHLIELGHRSIGAIAVAAGSVHCAPVAADATSRNHVVRERLAGWRSAASRAGLSLSVTISCPVNAREHGRHATRLLLEAAPEMTAVVCLSDELALGAIAELAARDLRVPQDISVVGFDDSPAAALAHPPLTTIRQPARDKGALAAELLIEQLRAEQPQAGQRRTAHVLETELVVRASTATPRPL
jgi:DNA-binding LacI/PurR family transcriptional regulator